MPREDSQIHPVNHTGFSSEVLLPGMTGSSALKQLTPNHHQKVLEKREAAADKWKNETRPDSCVDIFQMDDIHNSDISAEINDDDEEELDEETADGAGNGEKSPDDGDVFAVLGCGGSRDWSKKRQSSNESRKSASQGIRSQENNEEAERLFRMIEKKDDKGVEEILFLKKINLSSRNAQGDGFVMAAVQTRCLPLVETLLSAGADVNAKGAHHSTALHVACGNGDYDTARRLLAAGADPNCAQDDGSTPLHCACQPGDSSRLVQLLLDSGATADATCTKGRTSSGYTAVHLAAEVGDANTVRLLVDRWPEGVGAELSNAATPLHVACRHGYQEVTRQLLERGARTDALARDLRGHDITPLHMAIENIHLEPVRTLIEAGANVDAARVFSNRSGVTALHLAVLKRNLKIVQLLLDAGCRINDQDSDGSSALHLAARVGHHAITDELLKREADINLGSSSKNSTAQTPLHAAVRSRHVQIAKLLISYGSNVNQPEKMVVTSVNKSNVMSETGSAGQPEMGSTLVDAYTPLHWAVENKDLDMVCTLLDNGALPNPSAAVEEHTGLTPLHLACQDGYDLIARELLRCEGCDRNPLKRTLNRENITPLHQATYNGHVETVKVLLESDCDVNIQADNGYCALHYAAQQGNLELTKMILKHRGDVRLTASAKDQEHISALHLAVQSGNPSVVKALVEAGADINSEKTMIDIKGVTPLHQAVYQGKADIVELLLELGASVNASMGGWYTALHVAAEKGCAEIVTLLLRHSADVNAKASHQDHIGLTPLHVASQHGHTEVARQLIEAKANLQAIRNFSDRYGITALHLAAEYGFEDTVRALADLGCDLDAQDSLKFTPLHVAIQYNFPNIVSFLLDAGCDPKLKTVAGLTPSKMAEQNGNAEIRQIFKEKKRKSKSISFRRHSVNSNHSHANSDNNIMNSDRTTIEPANNNEKRMSSFMRLMCGLNKSS